MPDFSGKLAFVTGATSGIGLETARQLAASGADLALFSRKPDAAALAQVRAQCRSARQGVQHYALDVGDPAQTQAVLPRAVEALGVPDLVINSAGIAVAQRFAEISYEQFDQVMRTNLMGSRNVAAALLPHLQRKPGSMLVLVGSMASFIPVYGYTAYGASKFAVLGLAECLRYELKPHGVRVACFCPGEVETPALAAERETKPSACGAMKAIGGTMNPEPAVRGLLRGIASGQSLIIPGLRSHLVYMMFRLSPRLLWNGITDAIVAWALARDARRAS